MNELKAVNLEEVTEGIRGAVKPVRVLWQTPDSLAFVARGRTYRSEFHVDPSDEIMYMIKGDVDVHYVDGDGAHKVAVVREGEILYCPAGTPHCPKFSPDAFMLVIERRRREGEQDRFKWFCEKCKAEIFETVKHVRDYREDPVSRAYDEFYSADSHRTCGKCGHVTPKPAAPQSR